MELPVNLFSGLLAALGLGLLIGIERERRKDIDSETVAAGVRTHCLLALCGAAATLMGTAFTAVTGVAVAALVVVSYIRSRPQDIGLTGEIAMLATWLLGALAVRNAPLAVALAVVVAILLASKSLLHRVTRELMTEQEMHDLLMLAGVSLVVLPLLPDEPIDPWGVLKPYSLGLLVVLVMAIGAAGHVALRLVGARWGLPVAGFFSGFASSTAATGGFGQRARATPELCSSAATAALFANLASLLLFALVIGTAAPALLVALRYPLAAACLALGTVAALGLWHASRDEEALPSAPKARAFKLVHALLFAALVASLLLLSAWLGEQFGRGGAVIAAIFAALAELHAAAASLAQMSTSQSLSMTDARWGALALLGASVVSKSGLAFFSGGTRYGLRVTAGLVAMMVAATLAMWWLPV